MWIMVIKTLPIEKPVPPKLSVHWSTPWPFDGPKIATKGRFKGLSRYESWKKLAADGAWDAIPCFGREPDYANARRIRFAERDVRVWPHEFSAIKPEKMRFLVNENALTLESSDVASDTLIEKALKKGQRFIYEAALVDGCNHAEAMMVAFGKDPTIPDADFPLIGWYKCADEYARMFCRDWEMRTGKDGS
jgi:hypothetical protein